MPFRLDEIPFFDTTFMCEPAQPSHFTSYEDEVEPWDAPLRRRNNVSSHISSSHLYNSNRRDSHYSDIGSEDGMLVNEPFSRDPNIPMKKLQARKYEMSPRPSIVPSIEEPPVCYSPTPYSKPSVGNLRSKFNESEYGSEYKALRKRSAPKPPTGFEDQLEQRPQSSLRKGPAPHRPTSPYRMPKTDPIREMENIGKKQV
jgi:myosin III